MSAMPGQTVAALYVEPKGCYVALPGVDPWDEARDATPEPFRDLLLSIARQAIAGKKTVEVQ